MERLITSAEEVIGMINMMRRFGHRDNHEDNAATVEFKFATFDKIIDTIAEAIKTSNPMKYRWSCMFKLLGNRILEQLGDEGRNLDRVAVFVDLLLEKHKLYGAKPIMKWGSTGVLIRIDSKYHRIINLLTNGSMLNSVVCESVEDTRWDILGYCILGYIASTK